MCLLSLLLLWDIYSEATDWGVGDGERDVREYAFVDNSSGISVCLNVVFNTGVRINFPDVVG